LLKKIRVTRKRALPSDPAPLEYATVNDGLIEQWTSKNCVGRPRLVDHSTQCTVKIFPRSWRPGLLI